jgi:hypothetical protein
MTKEQQLQWFDEFVNTQREIFLMKWDDYANSDRLSNFKLAGDICDISPARQCLSLIATKVARLWQLLDWKKPNNESICDSILDLSNYSFLLHCIIEDGKTNPPSN